jgi:MFS family permease
LFAASSLLAGLGLLFFTIESVVPSIIFVILIGAAVQATYPVSLAMGSELAKGENIGVSVGFVFGMSGVMASFAPALIGYAADSIGLQASFQLLVILAVLALAVSFFLPARRLDS